MVPSRRSCCVLRFSFSIFLRGRVSRALCGQERSEAELLAERRRAASLVERDASVHEDEIDDTVAAIHHPYQIAEALHVGLVVRVEAIVERLGIDDDEV